MYSLAGSQERWPADGSGDNERLAENFDIFENFKFLKINDFLIHSIVFLTGKSYRSDRYMISFMQFWIFSTFLEIKYFRDFFLEN